MEKSYTAYTRPSALRISETSRKNRELLSVLAAQNEKERNSRPASRCSPVAPDVSQKSENTSQSQSMELEESNETEEMESVTVVNRCTSPGFPSQPNIQRTRRTEIARTVEKVITRPCRKKAMVDKEMQSDRLDDTSKYSRFGSNSARAAATPWCSFLDMKFSSPENDQKTDKQDDPSQNLSQATEDSTNKNKPNDSKSKEGSCSPKSISRTNSIKNLSRSFSKLDMKRRDSKSKTPPSPGDKKSKITTPKSNQAADKKLPPQIPKSDNTNKSGANSALNKDFRKSVLNMSQDGKLKKHPKRSNSQSSAESGSEAPNSEATDVSENLTTCTSYHKSSSSTSKLPQRLTSDGSSRRSCTPSSDISSASSAPSGSEDDSRVKSKQESKLRKRQNANATVSRTSAMLTAADELPNDKSPKPPLSPRVKTDGQRSEAEAKSFLMRALAPVTSLFKVRHVDSNDKVNWMDSNPENPNNDAQFVDSTATPETTEAQQHKLVLRKVESGEKAWWLDEENESAKQNSRLTPEEKIIQKSIRHVDSGERPWWLDSNSEPPEGIQKCPSEHSQDENSRNLYKIRKNDSGCKEWWLDSSENNNTSSNKNTSENQQHQEAEYLQGYRLRHIDSGERAWWMTSNENINEASKSESVQKELENNKKTYRIRHQSSGEKAWWMDSPENVNESSKSEIAQKEFDTNRNTYRIRHQSSGEKAWWMDSPEKELQQNQSDDDSDNDMAPLGDRASPEGLETPREEELQGRTTPYDNVPSTQSRARRPANISLFISRHTNIDDILGGTTHLLSPLMDTIFSYRKNYEECEEIDPGQVRIHDSTAQRGVIEPGRM